jgi:hypothetical protein
MWDTTVTPSDGLWVQAIQVTLRVWDPKTELTRQVTIVVPL